MSASDKKKLRKAQAAAALSERQKQEQAEAKKLRAYTIGFVGVIALCLAVVMVIGAAGIISWLGIFQKSTVAATVGDHEINTVEMNYYFSDTVNEYYNAMYEQFNTYTDSYLTAIGLDNKTPLNELTHDEETGATWADYFLEQALASAKHDYALYDLAMNDPDFELSAEEKTALDNMIKNLETYAKLYGYKTGNQYLRAMYGDGSTVDSYSKYLERTTIADAYLAAHEDSLTYDDSAIRKYEEGKIANYNSYSYSSAYMSYTEFLPDSDDENKKYTDEENAAAREALKAAAEKLASAKDLEEMQELLKTIEVNKSSQLAINGNDSQLHTEINAALGEWLAAEGRQEGDIAAIPNTSTTKAEDGTETTVTNGYYVAYFKSRTDNTAKMDNVRHLLVQFKGGTQDESTGKTVYTDEEKTEAKTQADAYLKEWKEGTADEDSFIQLVKDHSDDTSASEGGLFEDIHPDSNYVPNFLNWAIDPARVKGNTEVIETEYGYHVMYYVGESELSYRDYMITNEMRAEDQKTWYDGILEPVAAELKNTSKVRMDMTLYG